MVNLLQRGVYMKREFIMNDEENKLIKMLGEIVNIEEIDAQSQIKGIAYGKYRFHDETINAYIIEDDLLKNKKEYEGKVISVIEMQEKDEKRIVVAKKASQISYAEIKGYFRDVSELKNAKLHCLFEKSAGVILYKKISGKPHYLIIYSKKNYPGFPKGHIEYGETEEAAAKREVLEETGVQVELKSNFRETISYIVFDTPIQKEVVFFLAEMPENEKINIDINELNGFEIVTFDEAKSILDEGLMEILKVAENVILG